MARCGIENPSYKEKRSIHAKNFTHPTNPHILTNPPDLINNSTLSRIVLLEIFFQRYAPVLHLTRVF